MLALAKYALKGQYQAATVVASLVLAAVFFPLFAGASLIGLLLASLLTLVACTLVGLIILTQGTASGLRAISVAILGITLVTTIVLKEPALGVSIGLAQWLPIILLAQTLRSTKSLAAMLLIGVLLAAIGIGIQYIFWPELEAEWVQQGEISREILAQNPSDGNTAVLDNMTVYVHWMVLSLGSASYLLFVSILLMARSLQAQIAASDGFGREFQALSLGKQTSLAGLVILILALWFKLDWMMSLVLIIIVSFVFQGIAVVHARTVSNSLPGFVIRLFYVLLLFSLVFFPPIVAFIAIAGLLDNWLIFRKPRNIDIT